VKPPYSRLTAYDLNQGTIVWQVPVGDGPRNHPLLKHLNLGPLGSARGTVLLTKTLLFIGLRGGQRVGDTPEPPTLQALDKGKKEQGTVQYYLGQLGEAKGNEDEALAHYREVKDGEYLYAAQLRVAYLLSKRGKLDEAREFLHQAQAVDNRQRVQLILIEAQLLREAKRVDESYQVLQQGLEKLPNHPDLLYETAMMADKAGKPEVFEKLMRKLIQLQPDHAHAYNALGYSLLERNERIPEAVGLVEKALQLAPDDFAIMDSVGWGYYRSGRLDESLKILRRAFAGNPDPEIAAHLGEVLWMHGDKDEAKNIWQDSLKANPGNAQLQAVIKKFTAP